MPVAHKGAISFGLVYIPVQLYTATQENDIRFNQLAKENNERVRYVKTCKGCKAELKPDDIVKGFQYEKNKYVVLSDEDFDKIKTEKDRSIEILQFTPLAEIPPVYYKKSYQIVSEKGGEKAYALLRQAMLDEKQVAIGKTVLGNNETILMLMPTDDGLMLVTLYYHDEIKEMPVHQALPEVDGRELDLAKQLMNTMQADFAPEKYEDEYQVRLRDLIQKKIEGQEITAPKSAKPDNVINLMDALKESVQQNKKPAPRKKTTKKSG